MAAGVLRYDFIADKLGPANAAAGGVGVKAVHITGPPSSASAVSAVNFSSKTTEAKGIAALVEHWSSPSSNSGGIPFGEMLILYRCKKQVCTYWTIRGKSAGTAGKSSCSMLQNCMCLDKSPLHHAFTYTCQNPVD